MDKSALINKLQFVGEGPVGLELYFLYRKKSNAPIEILRVDLEDINAQTKLQRVFTDKIKADFLNQDSEGKKLNEDYVWNLKHIKEVDDLKNTFYFFPNKVSENDDYHIPEEFNEMSTLQNKSYESFELFKHSNHLLDNVFAYLIRLQIDSKQVILFKQKYPIDILTRSTILKVPNHASRFVLENEPLLKISDRIDFMFVNNNFIILNLKLLETKYGFNERYLKMGALSLNLIKDKNILTESTKIEELSKTVSFAKKLMKIKSDNEVLKTTISDMKTFLENYKSRDGKVSLTQRIKFIAKQNKFQVTTKAAAEDFVKLLNDEYLISLLTKNTYISPIKEAFEDKGQPNTPVKMVEYD